MTKDIIITREQVRTQPSCSDRELPELVTAPPYVSLSVPQECYYLFVVYSQYESPAPTVS